ncbi:MAG TPA: XdhC family protein [Syntrophales bacterium]|nr:XdhC family protein [Syntrophales bacterium]
MDVTGRNKSVFRAEDVFSHVLERLRRREPVVLATVMSLAGSGPRGPGAVMAVFAGGGTLGSVGGGPLEAEIVRKAGSVVMNRNSSVMPFSLTDQAAAEGGMVCGGTVEVLVEFLDGSPDCVSVFAEAGRSLEAGRRVWLIRSIRPENGEWENCRTGIGLFRGSDEGEFFPGTLDLSGAGIEDVRSGMRGKAPSVIPVRSRSSMPGDFRLFLQPLEAEGKVFIFGAGHVGRDLASVCGIAGFRTIIVDDRGEFANRERFPDAEEIRVVPSYEEFFAGRGIDDSGYVVIVTRGHNHDREILARALKTPAAYIGMIASRRKREIIFSSLRAEGYGDEDLKRVHSPIGLEIGAETPSEIAVSIAAELIRIRSERRKG